MRVAQARMLHGVHAIDRLNGFAIFTMTVLRVGENGKHAGIDRSQGDGFSEVSFGSHVIFLRKRKPAKVDVRTGKLGIEIGGGLELNARPGSIVKVQVG